MNDLREYQILTTLKEQLKTITYRGIRKRDFKPVVLKMFKDEYPDIKDIAKLKHEYKIIKQFDSPSYCQNTSPSLQKKSWNS